MSAVPKSLGVLPPFVLQYDPSNAPVVQVGGDGRRAHGTAALRLRAQQHRAGAGGDPRRRQRLASTAGASARSTWSSIPCKAQARGITSTDVAAAVAQLERAASVGRVHLAQVRRQRLHQRGARPGERHRRRRREDPRRRLGPDPGRGARGRRRRPGDAVGVGRRPERRLPQRPPRARAATPWRSSTPSKEGGRARRPSTRACASVPVFDQSTFVRTTYDGLKKEVDPGAGADRLVILLFLQSMRGNADRLGGDSALVRHHAHRPLCHRPDVECVHAGRSHPGDGAPGG